VFRLLRGVVTFAEIQQSRKGLSEERIGFQPHLTWPALRFAAVTGLMEQLGYQGRPAGLMAGAEALPGIAMDTHKKE
jgi:hypothetical protein